MIILRRKIGQKKCDKVPKYILDAYYKAKNKDYKFMYRKIMYLISKTKIDSVMLLSKWIENDIKKKTERYYISIIGPENIIKNIKFGSKDKGTIIIGTHINGKESIAKNNYIIEYMGGIIQIKQNEKIWINDDGKIIIGWHGSYNPPKGM